MHVELEVECCFRVEQLSEGESSWCPRLHGPAKIIGMFFGGCVWRTPLAHTLADKQRSNLQVFQPATVSSLGNTWGASQREAVRKLDVPQSAPSATEQHGRSHKEEDEMHRPQAKTSLSTRRAPCVQRQMTNDIHHMTFVARGYTITKLAVW